MRYLDLLISARLLAFCPCRPVCVHAIPGRCSLSSERTGPTDRICVGSEDRHCILHLHHLHIGTMAPTRTAKTKNKDVALTNTTTSKAAATTTVSWPALPTPSQRSHPLELEELVSSQIVLLHGFFPSKVCTTWVNYLSEPKNLSLEATPPAKRGEAQRTNHRFSVRDEAFAEALWKNTGLAEVIQNDTSGMFQSSECVGGTPIGLNPNIRVRMLKLVCTKSWLLCWRPL